MTESTTDKSSMDVAGLSMGLGLRMSALLHFLVDVFILPLCKLLESHCDVICGQ